MSSSTFDPETDPNMVVPGSPGGVIEAVKRGVITAFRSALTDTSISNESDQIHVDLEYPLEEASYPGIWVQFSLSDLTTSGMGMLQRDPESGALMQQFRYEGRVTLTLVALTSIERDRLADRVISMLAFSRVPSPNLFTENGFQESYSSLYAEFDANPYLSITINSDKPRPGGQSVTVGVPWDQGQLAYEDAYSFEVVGEFMLVTENDGLYRLSRVEINKEIAPRPPADDDDGKGKWI